MKGRITIKRTKEYFVTKIARELKKPKVTIPVVDRVIRAFLKSIEDELVAGNHVGFWRFGCLRICTAAERTAHNPKTGAKVYVPAKRVVKFKPGVILRQRVRDEVPLEPLSNVYDTPPAQFELDPDYQG